MPQSSPAQPVRSSIASPEDRRILRELAARYAELASHPRQAERIRLWKLHNELRPERPMILVYPEGSWRELIDWEGVPHCTDPWLRQVEDHLRMTIYEQEHFDSDNVASWGLNAGKAVWDTGWGIDAHWQWSDSPTGARRFDPVIHEFSDLDKIRYPDVVHDEAESQRRLEIMNEALGDLVPIRLRGIQHISYHPMSLWTSWRGLEETYLDMAAEPGFTHAAMERLTEGLLRLTEQKAAAGLFDLNNDNTYHATGGNGWIDSLPAVGHQPGRVRLADLWASAESQELSDVSPEMHEEFAMHYEGRLLEPFGLNGYGCCDGLHLKIDRILRMPRIRRISMSPFCKVDIGIPALGRKAIFSWKPQPAHLVGHFDEERIRGYLRHTIELAREHGTILEIILKDTHTCENHPERFDRWTQICREEVDRSMEAGAWPSA